MNIGIVACAAFPKLTKSNQLYANALRSHGANVRVLLWDKDPIDMFRACDLVVLRQTWDAQDDPVGFAAWAVRAVSRDVRFQNPAWQAVWNNDKRNLSELAALGIRIPKMMSVIASQKIPVLGRAFSDQLVLKPAIGGAGDGVIRCDAKDIVDTLHQAFLDTNGRPYLVEEFIPEFMEGQLKLICIDGRVTFSVLSRPAPGEFRTNEQYGAVDSPCQAPEKAIAAAEKIMKWAHKPLYGRVDGVMSGGQFICTGLKLTDPALYFEFNREAAEELASATLFRARYNTQPATWS